MNTLFARLTFGVLIAASTAWSIDQTLPSTAKEGKFPVLYSSYKNRLLEELAGDKAYLGTYLAADPRRLFIEKFWDYTVRYHGALAAIRDQDGGKEISKTSKLDGMTFDAKDPDILIQIAAANPRNLTAVRAAYQSFFRNWVRSLPEYKDFLTKVAELREQTALKRALSREHLDIAEIENLLDLKRSVVGRDSKGNPTYGPWTFRGTALDTLGRDFAHRVERKYFSQASEDVQKKLRFKDSAPERADLLESTLIRSAFYLDTTDDWNEYNSWMSTRPGCNLPPGVADAPIAKEHYGSGSLRPKHTFAASDSIESLLGEMKKQFRRGYGCAMPFVSTLTTVGYHQPHWASGEVYYDDSLYPSSSLARIFNQRADEVESGSKRYVDARGNAMSPAELRERANRNTPPSTQSTAAAQPAKRPNSGIRYKDENGNWKEYQQEQPAKAKEVATSTPKRHSSIRYQEAN